MTVADMIGIVGVVLIVGSYLLLQLSVMRETQIRFHFLNALGALMILYSLYFEFNFGAAVIEVFWAIVSIYGMIKCMRSKTEAGEAL